LRWSSASFAISRAFNLIADNSSGQPMTLACLGGISSASIPSPIVLTKPGSISARANSVWDRNHSSISRISASWSPEIRKTDNRLSSGGINAEYLTVWSEVLKWLLVYESPLQPVSQLTAFWIYAWIVEDLGLSVKKGLRIAGWVARVRIVPRPLSSHQRSNKGEFFVLFKDRFFGRALPVDLDEPNLPFLKLQLFDNAGDRTSIGNLQGFDASSFF
jgi:hypothetical protein